MSRFASIVATCSMIQGSVMGPPSFIVEASALHTIHRHTALMKYADDSYLLIGSNNISTAAVEFNHIISQWARNKNLRLNPLKTRLSFKNLFLGP